jgi:hypothetical protein
MAAFAIGTDVLSREGKTCTEMIEDFRAFVLGMRNHSCQSAENSA